MIEFISSLPGGLSPLIKKQGNNDNLDFILYGKTDLTIFMEMLVPYQEFFFCPWPSPTFPPTIACVNIIHRYGYAPCPPSDAS